jgi:branched-subunit amino acid aminotransferase/4-amino-4-deoxychorismate lyase
VLNLELNGRAPDLAEIQRLTTRNYGHFTSMQLRAGRVRGFALHLARLDDGNDDFFGGRGDVADELRLRELIRHALGGARDASVRVAYVPAADEKAPPDVLVSVGDPIPDTPGPALRVQTRAYERDWPEHKHSATMGLTYARRQARQDGFDDALFVGPGARVSEGSTWNAAFWDGERVLWPEAPVLKGVTMVLLQVAMTMTGVPWGIRAVLRGELPDLLAAAAVNSICPAQPIASVDDVVFTDSAALTNALQTAWQTVPWDEI